jgi:hypothetical protein
LYDTDKKYENLSALVQKRCTIPATLWCQRKKPQMSFGHELFYLINYFSGRIDIQGFTPYQTNKMI